MLALHLLYHFYSIHTFIHNFVFVWNVTWLKMANKVFCVVGFQQVEPALRKTEKQEMRGVYVLLFFLSEIPCRRKHTETHKNFEIIQI